ncbi:MAG TPA: TRAP transporter small permease [Bosea sp. (in: a-proteobacteria)]|nr:TRAP transporter small permease [Bosea sp. (in: a-proteobacteria)]
MTRLAVVAQCLVMTLAILWQVVARLLINRSPPWTEEIALLMFGWIVMLMLALGAREHLHVRIDTLVTRLPQGLARLADRVISIMIVLIGAYLLWASILYFGEMRGTVSAAARYPSEWLYACAPVASLLLMLFTIENALLPQRDDGR